MFVRNSYSFKKKNKKKKKYKCETELWDSFLKSLICVYFREEELKNDLNYDYKTFLIKTDNQDICLPLLLIFVLKV